MAPISNAILLNSVYVADRRAAIVAGGEFSAAACKVARTAFNLAIVNGSLAEIKDLEETIATIAPASRRGIKQAMQACYALAFGVESADRNGRTVFTVPDCDCKADRLLEVDRRTWQSRAPLLRHLDSFTVKVTRQRKAEAPDKAALLDKAVAALEAFKAAGGTVEEFAAKAGIQLVSAATVKAARKARKAA